MAPMNESDISSLDEKILELVCQLKVLRDKQMKSNTATNIEILDSVAASEPSPVTEFPEVPQQSDNTINRQYLVGSILSGTAFVKRNDPFYKSMLENCENSRNATLPLNRISKAKSSRHSTELLESKRFREKISLYELIKPHLESFHDVSDLVILFFESELCHVYSFLNRSDFFLRFYRHYGSDLVINTDLHTQADYIFLGQLLLVLRISFLSRYTASRQSNKDNHYVVSEEVVPLARLCLEEVDRSMLGKNTLAHIQLLMLLNYYQLHSPEYGSNSADYLQFDISRLVKICLRARYNVDPLSSNPHCHMIRKIWFHVMELNYLKFIKDGDPLIINALGGGIQFTTQLPSLSMAEDEIDKILIANMISRTEVHELFQRAHDLVSDVVTPPSLKVLHQLFDDLLDFMTVIGLSKLLSSVVDKNLLSRLTRLLKMTTLLDLYTLFINLGIPLFYNYKSNKNFHASQDILTKLATFTGKLLPLNYFMDKSSESLKFNINAQFGHSLHVMGLILESNNRIVGLLVTLLSRICYYGTFKFGKEAELYQKSTDVIFKNLKVLLFNIGSLSDMYLFAKEVHLLNVLKIIMNFGKDKRCHMTKGYLHLLQQNEMLKQSTKFDEEVCTIVVGHIAELNGEEESLIITDDGFLNELVSSNESIDLYFEKCYDSFFDYDAIERLEKLIDKDSFLKP